MKFVAGALLFLLCCFPQPALPLTTDEITTHQARLKGSLIAHKIAFWAELFIGTPYDTDPLGDYVRRAVIVADERVDCMYLTFRTVELALTNTPDEAVQKALTMRFRTLGIADGRVVNYDERYQDGGEMVSSDKYGDEITNRLGKTHEIADATGKGIIRFLPGSELRKAAGALQTGDIIFFIRDPSRREAGEVVAHMGIVKVEEPTDQSGRKVFLIHASGNKRRGGLVKKVPLDEYIAGMQHVGAKVSRFTESAPSIKPIQPIEPMKLIF
jgi:hypothetical protein